MNMALLGLVGMRTTNTWLIYHARTVSFRLPCCFKAKRPHAAPLLWNVPDADDHMFSLQVRRRQSARATC
jgi:hypothetical protein